MSNARNISKADSRFVNATGDTMSGALTGQAAISCKPSLTVHGASTSSVPEVRLDAVNYSGIAGDEQGGIVWVGGDASTPGYDTERARIDAKMTDEYNRVGLSFKVGAYSNPVPYEVMYLDAHGRMRIPYQPAFVAYRQAAGNVTYGAGANVSADMTSTQFNIGNHYSASTGRFTAPVAGRYFFYCAMFNGSGASGRRLKLSLNGGGSPAWGQGSEAAGSAFNASGLLNMAAGDYVFLQTAYDSTAIFHDTEHSMWGGYLLG